MNPPRTKGPNRSHRISTGLGNIMTRTQGAISQGAMQLRGVPHRTMRLPLVEATPDEIAALRADLEEAVLQ